MLNAKLTVQVGQGWFDFVYEKKHRICLEW